MIALTVEQAKQLITETEDLIILDTREAELFADGFIPGSIFIGLHDRFEDWATSILPADGSYLLVTETGKEKDTVNVLKKAGITNINGYLKDSFESWEKNAETKDLLIQVDADELAMDLPFDENLLVLDVRTETEFAVGHVKDAINMPLKSMADPGVMAILDEKNNLYVHGKSTYQGVIAASLLKRQGFHNLRYIGRGWDAIMQEKRIETEKEKSALN